MKPILFSTEMVQAILTGRKTMTRRVLNPKSTELNLINSGFSTEYILSKGNETIRKYNISDILWVRETWQNVNGIENGEKIKYAYKADGGGWGDYEIVKWKPSIFMPKEAARIFLRITDIRIEKLKDISKEDAIAEGIMQIDHEFLPKGWKDYFYYPEIPFENPINSFASLWESINGDNSWSDNPYVWVICFEKINKPETL